MLLELIFPKRCVACRKIGAYLCNNCGQKLRQNILPLCVVCDRPAIGGNTHPRCLTRYTPDGLTAAFVFQSPTKELLHELKYKGVSDIAAICAAKMARSIPSAAIQASPIVVAVPLYKARLRERGFNQSALLAKAFAERLGLQYRQDLLERIKRTQSQTKLNREERRENVAGAFLCKRNLKGRAMLLVDDTVTTGATLRSCTSALKRSGASFVWAVAFAQTPLGKAA